MPTADSMGFTYDIFLSYSENDESTVNELREMYTAAGIRTFFAPVDLRSNIGRDGWDKFVMEALEKSQHLGLNCSKDSMLSDWVKREVKHFCDHRSTRPHPEDCLILIMTDPKLDKHEVDKLVKTNSLLSVALRPRDTLQALQIVAERKMTTLTGALDTAQAELDQTKALARKSFEHYRHARFWRPFAQDRSDRHERPELHVFTCGRDTEEDRKRGAGGRTNIDKWDYQAAVDITHHFARHHRDVGVQIEQPASKARIDENTRAFDTTEFSLKLADRNCVIIGSPDVSDFAEITLAKLLNVDPYSPGWGLRTGFKIIKDGPRFSSFYEPSSEAELEGIRLIKPARVEPFVNTLDRAHGVMVLADNPFSRKPHANKILILAGHSGVATRAMSLLLTNEELWCLDEFYKLDQRLAITSEPVAAVIEVSFDRHPRRDQVGDDRMIPEAPGKVRFMDALALEP